MNKKILSLVILFLISMNIFSQHTKKDYDDQWTKVQEFMGKSLPQSAIKETEAILNKATTEKKTSQIIKAYIYLDVLQKEIDRDTENGITQKLEELITKTNKPEEHVLIHSILASEYYKIYRQDRWNINQRTNLSNSIPADIKEWTANIFVDKIYDHLEASVKDKKLLEQSTTSIYEDIIQLGVDSRVYQPTLYDFIMCRAIEIAKNLNEIGNDGFDLTATGVNAEQLLLPAQEYIKLKINDTKKYAIFNYYQDYLANLLERKLIGSIILIELDKYDFIDNKVYSLDDDKKTEALYTYESTYNKNETTAEIIEKIVSKELIDYNWQYTDRNTHHIDVDIKQRRQKAYDWIQKGLKQYPNYKRINILKEKLQELEYPSLSIEGKSMYYSSEDIILNIKHKNNQAVRKEKAIVLYKDNNGVKTLVKTYPVNYTSKNTFNEEEIKLELGKLPYGKYYLQSKSDVDKPNSSNKYTFSISDLMTFYRSSAENEYEIFVVNRKNGKPVSDAEIIIYESKNEKRAPNTKIIDRVTTNNDGVAIYKDRTTNNRKYEKGIYAVHSGNDIALTDTRLYDSYGSYNYTRENDKENLAISIFSDRTIYRPGQTLYFKTVILDKDSRAISNKKQTVKLYNPHREVIAEKKLRTNEYGSFAGEFIIPKSGLLGSYYIQLEEGNPYYISVEEYKRPTFEVKFDKIDGTFSFGDKITLKGYVKTFSGISLQNTEVRYNISREAFSFWRWKSGGGSHFEDGTVKTKEDGSFEIAFTPTPSDDNNLLKRNIYSFNIDATVTDLNGETQTGSYSIAVGNVSMVLEMEIPNQIEKSQELKIEIAAKNLDGKDIENHGSYQIFTVDQKDSIQTQVAEGKFKTGLQEELTKTIKKLSSGKHRIIIKAKDDKGREITDESDFILFSYSDKKPPYETDSWLVRKNTKFRADKPAEVIFGSSRKNIFVLYQVYNNQQVFDRKFIEFSYENKTFKLNYDPKYGEEVYMSLTSIIDGKLITENILISLEEEIKDTELKIKASVFRDKLRPGQEEIWTLSVSNKDSQPALAEVLASMYDTSLDKIRPYIKWTLQRPYIYKEQINPFWYRQTDIRNQKYIFPLDYKVPDFTYSSFDFDRLVLFSKGISNIDEVIVMGYANTRSTVFTGAIKGLSSPTLAKQEAPLSAENAVLDEVVVVREKEEATNKESQVRQNFNETAFFYPQLRTNEQGETLISFTVPESNTTWRFRAIAHDKEGKVGELEKMVITRKELMVTPNMPRFIRQGDKTSISTKISNLSENTINGEVKIEFFNPLDESIVLLHIENISQTFSIAKDASSSASWTFDVPNNIEILGVRIVAESESFSDGEQHALAVLPNRMLVTETMPVDVTQKGEQVYSMDKLMNNKSSSIVNERLTFEFTSNPAWYAVQALPTMSNPTNENTISWFASYFVNTLGNSLMKQYPKVANMIKAWKTEGGDKETLVSKLNQNEDLKIILLEETPWVLDAKNETEQMERLSLLFDLNNTQQLTSTALEKLQELQLEEGAWSWYKGMYPRRDITQYLLFGFATLQRIGMVEYPENVRIMQMNALKYVDQQIIKDFENLKKNNKEWEKIKSISISQLEYLYIRAMYRDIPISQEAREAERFYTNVICQNWTKLSLYEKSLLAVLAKELGNTTLANSITKSIREYAVNDKEKGMYWPNNKNRVFLSMSAVCSHIFVMEALIANGATKEEIAQMKRWLIKQKQTQVWENTNATIHAISILLQDNEDWFSSNAVSSIKVGKQSIKMDNKAVGTGYIKTSWTTSDIKNEMGKVSIISENNQPAYGALYWQYYEDLDKITKQEGSLNINKELYKEIITKDGNKRGYINSANC